VKLSIAFDAAGLEIALFQRKLAGWRVTREARLTWKESRDSETFSEKVQAVLRPILLAWGVPPQTTVLLVPPTDVGGIVSATHPGKLEDGPAACEKALASRLPFAIRELTYAWKQAPAKDGKGTHLAIYWLPKNWVADVRAVLGRLGLRVDEIYSRAFLYSTTAHANPLDWVLLEQHDALLNGYLFRADGLPVASFTLDNARADTHTVSQRLAMAIHDFPDTASVYASGLPAPLHVVCLRKWPDQTVKPLQMQHIAERAFVRWHAGDEGIWITPEPQLITAKLTPWLIGAAVITLAVVIGFSWHERALGKEVTQLEASSERLRPGYRIASSKQRELFALQDTLGRIERFEKSPSPLSSYALITEQLPEKSWLLHYDYQPKQISIEGYGSTSDAVVKAFDKTPLAASTSKPSVALDEKLQPFAVVLHDRPSTKPLAKKQNAQPAEQPKPGAQAGT